CFYSGATYIVQPSGNLPSTQQNDDDNSNRTIEQDESNKRILVTLCGFWSSSAAFNKSFKSWSNQTAKCITTGQRSRWCTQTLRVLASCLRGIHLSPDRRTCISHLHCDQIHAGTGNGNQHWSSSHSLSPGTTPIIAGVAYAYVPPMQCQTSAIPDLKRGSSKLPRGCEREGTTDET
ncbi:hypothetical protein Ocin01_07328, partial [Orchesella cincta]